MLQRAKSFIIRTKKQRPDPPEIQVQDFDINIEENHHHNHHRQPQKVLQEESLELDEVSHLRRALPISSAVIARSGALKKRTQVSVSAEAVNKLEAELRDHFRKLRLDNNSSKSLDREVETTKRKNENKEKKRSLSFRAPFGTSRSIVKK